MSWIATNEGAIVTEFTFELATAVTDDGEGGLASATQTITIPVRLVPVSSASDVVALNEQEFPGSPAYRYVFTAWINDRQNYTFPDSLRDQGNAIGRATIRNREGRVECSIPVAPIEEAAKCIGEKFVAGWAPD